MNTKNQLSYGPRLTAIELKAFIRSLAFEQQADCPPICIWGQHGIGKSELIQELAQEWDWPLVYCSPAQFEEMGDLTGLPYLGDPDDSGKQSQLAPPFWVPKKEGPGILLIDDFNRADDRILRGIMPLLLQKKMLSWALPDNWIIILTANPDGGHYAVTTVDDALLSRMLHLNMVFDPKSWAFWAEKQQLPGQGIGFVLQHPEWINGHRTTPRTLAWFLKLWQSNGLLAPSAPVLRQLAESCLEKEVATAFIQYLQANQMPLPEPETIIHDGAKSQAVLMEMHQNDQLGADRLYLLSTRLVNYLKMHPSTISEKQLDNLSAFLLASYMPAEQCLLLMRALAGIEHPVLSQLSKHEQIAALLLL